MAWDLSEDKKMLYTPSGVEVSLESEVIELIPCGEVGIVALRFPYGRSDNVIAYETDGTIRWRFGTKTLKNGFTGGWCKGDKVRLYHPDGYAFIVDLETGKQLDVEQTK